MAKPGVAPKTPETPRAPNTIPRWQALDALRGLAMVWMTVYHFSFDLHQHGWIRQDFYNDPFWTWQRTAIVSLFLLCAGAGQAVATAQGLPASTRPAFDRGFWKRWGKVAGCALLVSAASYVMFPRSFIYFGVLHGIAVMLLVMRLTAGWGRWLWLCGALAIAAKLAAPWMIAAWPELEFLNTRAFNWLGLVSVKPITEDYVPLVPWLGVMWWGMAGAQAWLRRPSAAKAGRLKSKPWPALVWLGQHSLSYYMLHQPVLLGLLGAVAFLQR